MFVCVCVCGRYADGWVYSAVYAALVCVFVWHGAGIFMASDSPSRDYSFRLPNFSLSAYDSGQVVDTRACHQAVLFGTGPGSEVQRVNYYTSMLTLLCSCSKLVTGFTAYFSAYYLPHFLLFQIIITFIQQCLKKVIASFIFDSLTSFLPARRYASAGLCDSDVSVCPPHAGIVPSRAKAGS